VEVQGQRCPDCGEFYDEWEDADGKALRHPPKEPRVFMCFACNAAGEYRAAKEKSYPDGHFPPGVRTVLAPPDPASPKPDHRSAR
jgi:hypothetical protein